jgi:ring-1,2-phenylacetyl-CoA epoxidase subunit PaaC
MRAGNAEQVQLSETYRAALVDLLYHLADDELCLGHRDSEWLGLAPDIEEDVAFSSVAQDEVGHATCYFGLLHDLGEEDPDRLAFAREVKRWRNAVLLERPNGDWAYSIARHFLYDVFDDIRLEALTKSDYRSLAEGARKIRREETYHLQHFRLWFTRLGQAGGEARERLEQAINRLWPDVGGLFSLGFHEAALVEHGILPVSGEEMRRRWEERIRPVMDEAGIPWPGDVSVPTVDGRQGEHTDDLTALLDTMSEVYRLDPNAVW